MLKKISQCENFGPLVIISELIKNCGRKKVKILDIIGFFRKRIHVDFFYTEDILILLVFLKIIEIKKEIIILTKLGKRLLIKNQKKFNENFKDLLVSNIFYTPFIKKFLNINCISYDYYENKYIIKNSEISLKYFALRNLLIKLGILERVKPTDFLIINRQLIENLKEKNKANLRKISLDKLKESLLIKEKYGYEAEEFVLKYEKSRLKDNPNIKKINIISDLDVCAGYDIISYEDSKSDENIFIEVKSYSGSPSFFWSENEVVTSKMEGDKYYVYLVDRDKIKDKNYHPLKIQDPYKIVFNNPNDWSKTPKKFYFEKI